MHLCVKTNPRFLHLQVMPIPRLHWFVFAWIGTFVKVALSWLSDIFRVDMLLAPDFHDLSATLDAAVASITSDRLSFSGSWKSQVPISSTAGCLQSGSNHHLWEEPHITLATLIYLIYFSAECDPFLRKSLFRYKNKITPQILVNSWGEKKTKGSFTRMTAVYMSRKTYTFHFPLTYSLSSSTS